MLDLLFRRQATQLQREAVLQGFGTFKELRLVVNCLYVRL